MKGYIQLGVLGVLLGAGAMLFLRAQTDTTPTERDDVRTLALGIDQATADYTTLANKLYAQLQASPEGKRKKELEDQAGVKVKALQDKCDKAGKVLSMDVKDAPHYLHCVEKPAGMKK